MTPILRIKNENGEWTHIPALKGEKGDPGTDGLTPHIGGNGNWWIGEFDTGVKAEGTVGESGYTPIRGQDYYTDADKAEIVASVLAALPNAGGVIF